MNELCELTAAEIVCSIGGTEYRLSPLTAGDFGELERHLLHQQLRNRGLAPCRSPGAWTLDDLAAWLETPAGQAQALWLGLRRNHPGVTRQKAEELLRQAAAEESDLALRWPELLGGPPGNSTGQT